MYQLHAVSRTQQGRQREPSVKTHRSLLSAEFWRHYVLGGRFQRHAYRITGPIINNEDWQHTFFAV